MKAVGDLDRGGCPVTRALGMSGRAITRDHFHPWVLPKPLRHGLRGAIREKRHWLTALQVH
jgi:hypothetical protein